MSKARARLFRFTRPLAFSLSILVAGAFLALACQQDLDDRPCPCAEGWYCCADTHTCRLNCSDASNPTRENEPPDVIEPDIAPDPNTAEPGLPRDRALPVPLDASFAQESVLLTFRPGEEFHSPVTVELASDETPEASWFLLRLEDEQDETWEPVSGARHVPMDGEPDVVSWETMRGGLFVVARYEPRWTLQTRVDGESYEYTCVVRSAVYAGSDNGGIGPHFYTERRGAPADCPWPATTPAQEVSVLLRGFLRSGGPSEGSIALADPEAILHVRVRFSLSSQQEAVVGREAAYQSYDSTTLADSAEPADVLYDGYRQAASAQGVVTVKRLPTIELSAEASNARRHEPTLGRLYSVELTDVVLPAVQVDASDEPASEQFPPSVTITRAFMTLEL